jgi:hypothetical protein
MPAVNDVCRRHIEVNNLRTARVHSVRRHQMIAGFLLLSSLIVYEERTTEVARFSRTTG